MLQSLLRLGSQNSDLDSWNFRTTALGVTAGGAMLALAAFPAAAQQAALPQALTGPQCKTAIGVTIATMQKFKGKLSVPLLTSFREFMKDCDLKTKFDRVPGTADDEAWGEFRVMLTAIRTADRGKPGTLAAN
ncbi:hypothetical protein [uncultured Bradyrhizobium sp.]|uniref:hypothetical protein n=1 Tax=uncultured Bradyrhizobium sp. TaxID=199684 RepID=UPI0035CC4399